MQLMAIVTAPLQGVLEASMRQVGREQGSCTAMGMVACKTGSNGDPCLIFA
jgi:hypothetical protein